MKIVWRSCRAISEFIRVNSMVWCKNVRRNGTRHRPPRHDPPTSRHQPSTTCRGFSTCPFVLLLLVPNPSSAFFCARVPRSQNVGTLAPKNSGRGVEHQPALKIQLPPSSGGALLQLRLCSQLTSDRAQWELRRHEVVHNLPVALVVSNWWDLYEVSRVVQPCELFSLSGKTSVRASV